MHPTTRNSLIALTIATTLVVIGGFVMVAWVRQPSGTLENDVPTTSVKTFAECAAQGYPVQESYPRTCTADGVTYTEAVANGNTNVNIADVPCSQRVAGSGEKPGDVLCGADDRCRELITGDEPTSGWGCVERSGEAGNGNTNIVVDTAGWKTFTDPDGQYSFRHPKTLSIATKENPRPSYPNITVMHSLPEFGPWFPNVDLSITKLSKGGFAVTSRSDLTMNLNPDNFFILASTGDKAAQSDEYFIQFYQSVVESQSFEEIARQILASFVFLDPDANWNTYTNTTYGYSLKYPTDWQVTEKFGKDHIRLLPPGVEGDAPSETDLKGAIAVETSVNSEALEGTLLAPINDLYGTHGLMRGIINYDVYLFSRNGRNISLWRNVDFSDQRFREIVHTFNLTK